MITVLIAPLLATWLSGVVNDARLRPWLQDAIMVLSVLIASLIFVLFGVDHLTGNMLSDLMLVSAWSGWLLYGPLSSLHMTFVESIPSPLGAFLPQAMHDEPPQVRREDARTSPDPWRSRAFSLADRGYDEAPREEIPATGNEAPQPLDASQTAR